MTFAHNLLLARMTGSARKSGRKRLSPPARAVLSSGFHDPAGRCRLGSRLSGSALRNLLLALDREGFVRVDWVACTCGVPPGGVIGTLLDKGYKALRAPARKPGKEGRR